MVGFLLAASSNFIDKALFSSAVQADNQIFNNDTLPLAVSALILSFYQDIGLSIEDTWERHKKSPLIPLF